MALKFSMVLTAVDRVTAPARRIRASVGGMTSGFRSFGQQVGRVTRDINTGARSLQFYETRARRLRQVALGTFFRAARLQASQFASSLRTGIRNLNLMERAGRAAGSGIATMAGKMAGLAKWGAAGAVAGGGLALFDMFGTASKFEQYQVQLEQQLGSVSAAKKSMAWVQDFAQQTPYELDEVMAAFVRLKLMGIDPMDGTLKALGEGASGTNKTLMDAVEMQLDAMTNSYERLKEFGINANTKGKEVAFSYLKNNKMVVQKVLASDKTAIKETLNGIFQDRFGSMMERQSRTFAGTIANFRDTWSKFLLMVADAGIFDKVKNKLAQWYESLNAMMKSGQLKGWAKQISDGLGEAFDWATSLIEHTNWKQFGNDLRTVGRAAWDIAKGIRDAFNAYQRWKAENSARLYASTETGWFSSDKARQDAREKRQALEKQFGPLTPLGQQEAADERRRQGISDRWKRGQLAPPRAGSLLMRPTSSQGAPQVNVGGKLQINVKTDPGTTARVRASANGPMPLVVNLGQSMAWPG